MLHKMLSEFNSESCDKLDGCPFSNKETKKQKQKKFNGCQETSYKLQKVISKAALMENIKILVVDEKCSFSP